MESHSWCMCAQGGADRVIIYLTLYISACLGEHHIAQGLRESLQKHVHTMAYTPIHFHERARTHTWVLMLHHALCLFTFSCICERTLTLQFVKKLCHSETGESGRHQECRESASSLLVGIICITWSTPLSCPAFSSSSLALTGVTLLDTQMGLCSRLASRLRFSQHVCSS